MNIKYIYVVAILVIAATSIGCVDKTSEKTSTVDNPIQTSPPITIDTPSGPSSPRIADNLNNVSLPEVVDTSGNTSSPGVVDTSGNTSSPGVVNTSGKTSPPGVTVVPADTSSPEETVMPNDTSSPDITDVSTNDTSVTEIFKIGDEKTMLGVNIKLVNITDYDSNIVVLLINGVEYKYDSASETGTRANGIEVIDVTTLEDDKTAEITVDYMV